VKIGRGVRQGCCLSPILFNLYSECLTEEALEGFGDFKIGGQILQTVKYADDLVLLAKVTGQNTYIQMHRECPSVSRKYVNTCIYKHV